MRVIAGSAKGRRLFAPKDQGTRPVLAKVKGAIFNILGPIQGLKVLDLFAGSGAIGVEALSRGAVHVTFVENARPALKTLKRNLELCGFAEQSEIIALSYELALKRLINKKRKFDLIFVDPPYDRNCVARTLEIVAKVLVDEGLVIVESSPREPVEATEALKITDQRKYGQTWITFLQRR